MSSSFDDFSPQGSDALQSTTDSTNTSLADILRELNLTQTHLAQLLGLSYRTINQLVNGKRNITADIALRLGQFTQTSPELWLNLQMTYDLWNAVHLSGQEIEEVQPYRS